MDPEDLEEIWNELISGLPVQAKNSFPHGFGGWDFNCWGFCASFHGWIDGIEWIRTYNEMEKILEDESFEVEIPKPGDVVSLWGNYCGGEYQLLHTMLFVNDDSFLHKPGAMSLELSTKDRVFEIYSTNEGFYIDKITYHRRNDL